MKNLKKTEFGCQNTPLGNKGKNIRKKKEAQKGKQDRLEEFFYEGFWDLVIGEILRQFSGVFRKKQAFNVFLNWFLSSYQAFIQFPDSII
ncbi:hypothetical protein ACSAZL_00270 [Methanosarcina sp. T3]|uniref:hypothetical protein n=1 Tax=Methanosarcina sp. T3 TaxID=3439062 RepID=UPI003F86247B